MADENKSLFDRGRESYTEAFDGSSILTPDDIGYGTPEFAQWESGVRFEDKVQCNRGIFKRVLWDGCPGSMRGIS